MPLRAVIIDDHRLLAQSITLALRLEGVDCSVADLTDPEQLLADVAADAARRRAARPRPRAADR